MRYQLPCLPLAAAAIERSQNFVPACERCCLRNPKENLKSKATASLITGRARLSQRAGRDSPGGVVDYYCSKFAQAARIFEPRCREAFGVRRIPALSFSSVRES